MEERPFHSPKRWNPWTKNGRRELGDMVNICMNWLMFDSLPNDFPRFHQQVACAIYSLYAYIFGWWFHFLDFHPCGNDAILHPGKCNMEPKNHLKIKIRKYHLNQTSMSLGSKSSFSSFFCSFLDRRFPPPQKLPFEKPDRNSERKKSSHRTEVLWLRKRRGAQRWVAHWLWGTTAEGSTVLRLALLAGGGLPVCRLSKAGDVFCFGKKQFLIPPKTIGWYMVDATIFHIYFVYCTTYSLRKCFFCFSNCPTNSQDDIWPPSRYAPADVRSWMKKGSYTA